MTIKEYLDRILESLPAGETEIELTLNANGYVDNLGLNKVRFTILVEDRPKSEEN